MASRRELAVYATPIYCCARVREWVRETQAHQHTLSKREREIETEIKSVDHSPSFMKRGVGEGEDSGKDRMEGRNGQAGRVVDISIDRSLDR